MAMPREQHNIEKQELQTAKQTGGRCPTRTKLLTINLLLLDGLKTVTLK